MSERAGEDEDDYFPDVVFALVPHKRTFHRGRVVSGVATTDDGKPIGPETAPEETR